MNYVSYMEREKRRKTEVRNGREEEEYEQRI
jgi:hypothetical protein